MRLLDHPPDDDPGDGPEPRRCRMLQARPSPLRPGLLGVVADPAGVTQACPGTAAAPRFWAMAERDESELSPRSPRPRSGVPTCQALVAVEQATSRAAAGRGGGLVEGGRPAPRAPVARDHRAHRGHRARRRPVRRDLRPGASPVRQDRSPPRAPGDAAGDGRSHLEVPSERARRGLVARGRARRPPTTARQARAAPQLGPTSCREAYNLDIGGIE